MEKPVKMDFTMSSLVDDLAKSFLNLEGTISDIDDSDLKDLNEDFDEDKNEANLLSKLKEIKTETKDRFDKLIVKDEVIDTLSRKLTNLIDELSTSNDLLNNKKPDSQIEEDIVSGNDLTDNKLAKIELNSFRHLNKLNTLDLERNQIEQIDSNLFLYLNKLKILNLDGNQMNSNEVKNIQKNLPAKDGIFSAGGSNSQDFNLN